MVFFNHSNKNRTFLFTISLILMLSISSFLIISNQQNFTNDESPTKEFNKQIPKESNVYYEDTTGDAWDIYISGDYAYIADKNEG